ncbi:MAG: hypothetical protein KME26_13565 [Oscillatoria princeps RMCB-10]|nr:hypothetical protein [Oscillatoria princeps RMCB-10]
MCEKQKNPGYSSPTPDRQRLRSPAGAGFWLRRVSQQALWSAAITRIDFDFAGLWRKTLGREHPQVGVGKLIWDFCKKL